MNALSEKPILAGNCSGFQVGSGTKNQPCCESWALTMTLPGRTVAGTAKLGQESGRLRDPAITLVENPAPRSGSMSEIAVLRQLTATSLPFIDLPVGAHVRFAPHDRPDNLALPHC